MSLKTWKKEFYPVSAEAFANDATDTIGLLEHSLKKWQGAIQENLEKHKVYLDPDADAIVDKSVGPDPYFPDLSEDQILYFNGMTCALCHAYTFCKGCPLYEIRNNTNCNRHNFDLLKHKPGAFSIFISESDVYPMIALLEDALNTFKNRDKNYE